MRYITGGGKPAHGLKPAPAGFVTFSSLAAANAAAQTVRVTRRGLVTHPTNTMPHSDSMHPDVQVHAAEPGAVGLQMAPEPREVFWPGVVMPEIKRNAGARVGALVRKQLFFLKKF